MLRVSHPLIFALTVSMIMTLPAMAAEDLTAAPALETAANTVKLEDGTSKKVFDSAKPGEATVSTPSSRTPAPSATEPSNTQNGSMRGSVTAGSRLSRLSGMIQQKPKLYLPSRLLIGEPNTVVLQAPAGQYARIIITQGQPQNPTPTEADNILFQTEGVKIPNKGVVGVALPVPKQKDLNGINVFVTGEISSTPDFKESTILEWVDASGQRTSNNAIPMVQPTSVGRGPSVMPNMPGMNPQMMRQLNAVSTLQSGDERKKQLLDDGMLNRDSAVDRNSFLTRPGMQGLPNGTSVPTGF